jgi:hypothetical protein
MIANTCTTANECLNTYSRCLCVNEEDYRVQGTTSLPKWYGTCTIDNSVLKNAVAGINDIESIKSNWDYGVTLNEDAVKDIIEKITKEKELAKLTPDNGPEIPKWTGFLDI